MANIVEFEGLRFSTSFDFRNKKEEAKYWDNILINEPNRFRLEFNQFLDEKLHVYHSFFKVYNFLFFAIAILTIIMPVNWIMLGCTVFMGIVALSYLRKYRDFAIATVITKEINTPEFVEQLRQTVLDTKQISENRV